MCSTSKSLSVFWCGQRLHLLWVYIILTTFFKSAINETNFNAWNWQHNYDKYINNMPVVLKCFGYGTHAFLPQLYTAHATFAQLFTASYENNIRIMTLAYSLTKYHLTADTESGFSQAASRVNSFHTRLLK